MHAYILYQITKLNDADMNRQAGSRRIASAAPTPGRWTRPAGFTGTRCPLAEPHVFTAHS